MVENHVNACLDGGGAVGRALGGVRAPAGAPAGAGCAPGDAPVQLPPKLTLHLLTLAMLKTHLRKWKLLEHGANEKRDVLEARWNAFVKNVKIEADSAEAAKRAVDVAAAAKKTLRDERTRSSAALVSPIIRKHVAAAAAVPAAAAAVNGFKALVDQVRARKAASAAPGAAPEPTDNLPATDGRTKRKRSQG